MAAIWTMMALLGFGVVFELCPFLYVGARVAGVACLLYIAYRMWRSAGVPARAVIRPGGRAFPQGFLVNLFNPKSVLFAAAVLVTVFPAGPGRQHRHRRQPLPGGNRFLYGARLRHEHASRREALHAGKNLY